MNPWLIIILWSVIILMALRFIDFGHNMRTH